jgi:hypothetical protein
MGPARLALLQALVLGTACGGRPATPHGPSPNAGRVADSGHARLPAVPKVAGPLVLRVVYPSPEARIQLRDSSFLFGSAGTGDAQVTVNGYPARVWPNGAWLAWIPFPPDSIMQFTIEGSTTTDHARLLFAVRRAGGAPDRAVDALWLDSLSLAPRGRVWWPRDEYVTLTARASQGAEVRLRLPGGTVVPFAAQSQAPEIPAAVRAFDRDTSNLRVPPRTDRYVGVLRGRTLGPAPGPVLPLKAPPAPVMMASVPVVCTAAMPCAGSDTVSADSLWATVEAIRGTDTVRARWPLQLALLDTLPILAELDDDTAGVGDTDSLTVGRALPGGTYHWFFPTGTRTEVSVLWPQPPRSPRWLDR